MPDKYKRIAIVTGTISGVGVATMRKFVAAGFGREADIVVRPTRQDYP